MVDSSSEGGEAEESEEEEESGEGESASASEEEAAPRQEGASPGANANDDEEQGLRLTLVTTNTPLQKSQATLAVKGGTSVTATRKGAGPSAAGDHPSASKKKPLQKIAGATSKQKPLQKPGAPGGLEKAAPGSSASGAHTANAMDD